MIAAKYRLFSAEPKLVSSRDTRTEEAGPYSAFRFGRNAISPGWSAIESYPASTAGLVLRSRLVFTGDSAGSRPRLRSGHPAAIQIAVLQSVILNPSVSGWWNWRRLKLPLRSLDARATVALVPEIACRGIPTRKANS